jgi:membrane-associated protease RseP (regulator of RpoE activity)
LPASMAAGSALQMEGNSILYLFLKFVTHGLLLPAPATYGSVQPILYWIKYFFTSKPFPLGGSDVMLSPVAWAGWAGLLVTMLNLIPVGQLDGGHAFNVLFGDKGRRIVFPVIVFILGILGIFWNGWWLWAVLILLFGRMTAQPLDMISPVDGTRKMLAALALIIFILIFMPVPLVIVGI